MIVLKLQIGNQNGLLGMVLKDQTGEHTELYTLLVCM